MIRYSKNVNIDISANKNYTDYGRKIYKISENTSILHKVLLSFKNIPNLKLKYSLQREIRR